MITLRKRLPIQSNNIRPLALLQPGFSGLCLARHSRIKYYCLNGNNIMCLYNFVWKPSCDSWMVESVKTSLCSICSSFANTSCCTVLYMSWVCSVVWCLMRPTGLLESYCWLRQMWPGCPEGQRCEKPHPSVCFSLSFENASELSDALFIGYQMCHLSHSTCPLLFITHFTPGKITLLASPASSEEKWTGDTKANNSCNLCSRAVDSTARGVADLFWSFIRRWI